MPDLSEPTIWTSVGLPDRLPPGRYRFAGTFSAVGATQLTLGWEYGSYRFARYRKPVAELPALVAPAGTDLEYVRLAAEFAPPAERPEVERALMDWVRLGRPDQALVAMAALRAITERGAPAVGDRDAWLSWWESRR